MAKVKAYKHGQSGEPSFPKKYDIVQKAVLQVTDIKSNHNKYYALELHRGKQKGAEAFRVYTHYGRTDDLEKNPGSGQKECRYFDSLPDAQASYLSIYNQKTSLRKGYKEVSLASSNIGSEAARGASSGDIDEQTLQKLAEKNGAKKKKSKPKASELPQAVQTLVQYIYDEAKTALTSTVQASITADGIQTPLGVLTLGQIEKGERILEDMYDLFQKKRARNKQARLEQRSSDFYTTIPHRIGRSRQAAAAAVINSIEDFKQKQDTLQLMKDMLRVNDGEGAVLFNSQVDEEYQALGCELTALDEGSPEFQELSEFVVRSQIKSDRIQVVNVYRVRRSSEHEVFASRIGNQRPLFHGSRIDNWVGLLSRGILMPKIVTTMGVDRTDAGWLGNGIYFGDAACTSSFYTTAGKRKTRIMAIAQVALGKQRQFTKITYGLEAPPEGYDSCHGVRRKKGFDSEFDDDEYVIYRPEQQRMDFLVEFAA